MPSDIITAQGKADTAQLLRQGLALHQTEQWDRAKACYERVLLSQPNNADGLHLLGVLTYQMKNPLGALELIGRAIKVKPQDANFYSNLGAVFIELKRFEDAVASFDKAISINGQYADAYFNRGTALADLKHYERAIESFDKAIALRVNYAESYLNRGNALQQLEQHQRAVQSYDQAIYFKPDYVEAFHNRGNALKKLNLLEESLSSFDKAIHINANYFESLISRGAVLIDLGRLIDALESYNKVISIKENSPKAYYNRGNILKDLGRLQEAVESFDRAINIDPHYAKAFYNRANVLSDLGYFDRAVASFDKAIGIKPDYVEAHCNRGLALQELRKLDDAIASFDGAIGIDSEFVPAHWNKSIALLQDGRLQEGWASYEWRWKSKDLVDRARTFLQPLWLGQDGIRGKTILLHAEQGLGDTLQFCRYCKLVTQLGARVILEVPQALAVLLQNLDGVTQVVVQGAALPAFDYQCPLLSLPLAFKTSIDTIPLAQAYLSCTAQKRQEWLDRLGPRTKKRVALAWSGRAVHRNDHNRSISLQEILKHLPKGFEYVSLQKELREGDLDLLANGQIKHFGDEIVDFTDTAALCELMDLVISVDTSVAHLAGALGRKTWILLPYASDWRWMIDRDDSPWYESVRLYRQGEDRQWESVLQNVSQQLSEFGFQAQ